VGKGLQVGALLLFVKAKDTKRDQPLATRLHGGQQHPVFIKNKRWLGGRAAVCPWSINLLLNCFINSLGEGLLCLLRCGDTQPLLVQCPQLRLKLSEAFWPQAWHGARALCSVVVVPDSPWGCPR
jgi:hypothetical protein